MQPNAGLTSAAVSVQAQRLSLSACDQEIPALLRTLRRALGDGFQRFELYLVSMRV